eukprot:780377_1
METFIVILTILSQTAFAQEVNATYVFHDVRVADTGADQACLDTYGTHLASIHSAKDNAEAHALCVPQASDNRQGCWIGLNDFDAEAGRLGGLFKWYDGTPLDYQNWYPGEPNDHYYEGEDLAYISNSTGQWNDFRKGALRCLCRNPLHPTSNPTTVSPTLNPSTITAHPTKTPSVNPTQSPSKTPSVNPTQSPSSFPSVTPFYPLHCVIRYKDKSWASWYKYKLAHASDYVDILEDGLDVAFETVFGHSIMYLHLDSWEDKTWTRAGLGEVDFCRFGDVEFTADCPMYEAHGDEYVAVAVLGVSADRNVVDYVKYLRQSVRGEVFEYEFEKQVNDYLDNITLNANDFEVVSIDIIDPINVIFSTESASVTTMETEADTTDTIDTTDGNDSTYNSFGFIDYLIAGCVSFVCCLICVVCGCYFCTKHGQSQKNAEIIAIQSGDGTIPDVQNTEMTENVTDNADHLDQMADMAVLPDDPDDEHVPPPGGGGDADESDEEGEGNVDEEGGEGNADESCEENESDCVELRAWMKRPVGLEQYTEMMIYSGYRNMKDLEVMTLDDLKEMGVRKVAHRRKIY